MSTYYRIKDFFLRALVFVLRISLPLSLLESTRQRRSKAFGNRYFGGRAQNYDKVRSVQPAWRAEFHALEGIGVGLGQNLRVLDLPVGTGRFFPIYAKLDWVVTGLDSSKDMLREADVNGEKLLKDSYSLVLGDARRLDFADGTFDGVVCFRFLQSIVSFGDAELVLGELSRVTKSWAILHLGVNSGSADAKSLPRRSAPMRGLLTMAMIQNLLDVNQLVVEETIGPIPGGAGNDYVFLCRKKNDQA